MKYGELTLGQVEATVNKLGGMEGVKRFLAGKMIVRERPEFEFLQTVKLGLHKSTEEYRAALIGERQITSSGELILAGIPISRKVVELDLVVVDGCQLNPKYLEYDFKTGAQLDAVYKAAFRFDFDECPAEVGLALAEQYLDPPYGELIYIAMKPILDCAGHPRLFYLSCDDKALQLGSEFVEYDDLIGSGRRWVFVRSRK